MLIDARWQRHLIDTLRLGPLFKQNLEGIDSAGRNATNRRAAAQRPVVCTVDHGQQLLALLKNLGIGADVAAASSKRSDSSVAHAASSIAQWMSFLPEDCVKAMVRDGWHWST